MKTTKTLIRNFVTATTIGGFAMYAHAQNLNGTLNTGFYGSPLAVQTINTGFGYAGGGADSAAVPSWMPLMVRSPVGICGCSWRAISNPTATT